MLFLAIDGACRRNGKPDCLSTGSVFIRSDKGHVDTVLKYENGSTNQRGELTALVEALMIAVDAHCGGEDDIYLITDSEYVYNAIHKEWVHSWDRKGWVTASGGAVKNQDLWMDAHASLVNLEDAPLDLTPYHIKGHLISVGKVTARNVIESDPTGLKLYDLVESKYEEQKMKKPDKFDEALELFNRNHGFTPPLNVFKRFVILNTVADLMAGYYADLIDSGDTVR